MLTTRYAVTERQLEQLKNLAENYKEISSELCEEITLKVPTLSGRDMDRILDGLSPFEDDTETLKNRIESVANDLLSDAAAGLDEASIQDLQERLQVVERELSYLIEDIENQPLEDSEDAR